MIHLDNISFIRELINAFGWQITLIIFIICLTIFLCSWLFKRYLTFKTDKELEKFKSELTKEIESYRIQYSNLNTLRCEGIVKLYIALSDFYNEVRNYSIGIRIIERGNDMDELIEKQDQEILQKILNLREDFFKLYPSCKMLISKSITDKIDGFIKNMDLLIFEYRYNKQRSNSSYKNERMQAHKSQIEVFKKATEKLPSLLAEIETEFRELIGVQDK